MQGREYIRQHLNIIRTMLRQFRHRTQHCARFTRDQRTENLVDLILIYRTQHGGHTLTGQAITTVGNSLIGQTQSIAHTAISGPAELPECRHFKGNFFGFQNILQMFNHFLRPHVLEAELQAT